MRCCRNFVVLPFFSAGLCYLISVLDYRFYYRLILLKMPELDFEIIIFFFINLFLSASVMSHMRKNIF